MATITSSSTSSRLVITLGRGGICRRTKALYTKARTGQSGVPVSVAVAVWPGPCPCWCPCSMPTPGHYLFNSSTLTTLPGHGYTGNLGAATETRFACQAIRLPRQSVCLPVWLTPYCAIHMNNQRKAVGPISLLLASMHWPSIHSVRMCVWVCWCGCGHGCLLGVRWVYLLPAQGLPHIFILNLSLSSWQPHKYIHTHRGTHTHTVTPGRALGPLATELSCIIHEMHIIPTTAIMTAIQQCVRRLDRIMHMHNLLYSLFSQCNW